MRCGLVRLITRKSPYDIKIKRKGWNTSMRSWESGALCDIAESKEIGRCCAHKMCRLVEKSSKFLCRIISGNDYPKKRYNSSKLQILSKMDQIGVKQNLNSRDYKVYAQKVANVTVRVKNSKHNSILNHNLKPIKLRHSLIKDYLLSNSSFIKQKPARLHRICSKTGQCSFRPLPIRKIIPNKNSRSSFERSKSMKQTKTSRMNANIGALINTCVNVFEGTKGQNKSDLKNKSDDENGLNDIKVLNHLNETSCLSLSGCDDNTVKSTFFEDRNVKSSIFNNNINKFLNYCKKKNPFIKSDSEIHESCDNLNKWGKNSSDVERNRCYECEGKCNKSNTCHTYNTDTKENHKLSCNDPFNTKEILENIYNKDLYNFEQDRNKCARSTSRNPDSSYEIDYSKINDNITLAINNTIKAGDRNYFSIKSDKDREHQTGSNNDYHQIKYHENCSGQKSENPECYFKNDSKAMNGISSVVLRKEEQKCLEMNQCQISNDKYNNYLSNYKNKCLKSPQNVKDDKATSIISIKNISIEIYPQSGSKNQSSINNEDMNLSKCQNDNVNNVLKISVNNSLFADREENKDRLDKCVEDIGIKSPKNKWQPNNLNYKSLQVSNKEIDKKSRIHNFEEFMDIKIHELSKVEFNNFRFYDDLKYQQIMETIKDPALLNDYEKNTDAMSDESRYEEEACGWYEDKKKQIQQSLNEGSKSYQHYSKAEEKKNNNQNCTNDQMNAFVVRNDQRYNERVNMITKGPDFSIFPKSNWRGTMYDVEENLSQTFDVSNPLLPCEPIEIGQNKMKSLSRYSEINLAIQKVKNRIENIMNDKDELEADETLPAFSDIVKHSKCHDEFITDYPSVQVNRVKPQDEIITPEPSVNIIKSLSKNVEQLNITNYGPLEVETNVMEENIEEVCKTMDESGTACNEPAPSSIHLNDIIEAMKANNINKESITSSSDKEKYLDNEVVLNRKLPKTNIQFIENKAFYNPQTEKLFTAAHRETLCNRVSVRRMSTSSKQKFFPENKTKLSNKKTFKENFMDGTIFAAENFVTNEWIDDKCKKLGKQKSFIEYMSTKIQQLESLRSESESTNLPNSSDNKKMKAIGNISQHRDNQDNLYDECLNSYSKNKPTSSKPEKGGYYSDSKEGFNEVDRCENQNYIQDDAKYTMSKEEWQTSGSKFWKTWTPNNKTTCSDKPGIVPRDRSIKKNNEITDNLVNNQSCKINWNEGDRLDSRKTLNNGNILETDQSKYTRNNRSEGGDANCINVVDVGLNFTSFSPEMKRINKEKKEREAETCGRAEWDGSRYGSANKINEGGAANMSTSAESNLHLQESRALGLRQKNELSLKSFNARNSLSLEAALKHLPCTSTRQASSGRPSESHFKNDINDKLKNMRKIEKVDIMREEICSSEKEPINTIKITETYASPAHEITVQESLNQHNKDSNRPEISLCSKEIVRQVKNKSFDHENVTKQVNEEMNITGVFQDGKKTIHGKLLTVTAKPRSKFTSPKNEGKGEEGDNTLPNTDYNEPSPSAELIKKCDMKETSPRRKMFIGDVKRRLNKLDKLDSCDPKYVAVIETENNDKPLHGSNEKIKYITKQDADEEEFESEHHVEKKSWKKYEAKNTIEQGEKVTKPKKWSPGDKIGYIDVNKFKKEALVWEAPRNKIFDRVVKLSGDKITHQLTTKNELMGCTHVGFQCSGNENNNYFQGGRDLKSNATGPPEMKLDKISNISGRTEPAQENSKKDINGYLKMKTYKRENQDNTDLMSTKLMYDTLPHSVNQEWESNEDTVKESDAEESECVYREKDDSFVLLPKAKQSLMGYIEKEINKIVESSKEAVPFALTNEIEREVLRSAEKHIEAMDIDQTILNMKSNEDNASENAQKITSSESKYDADSPSFPSDGRASNNEEEKLVVTHFKQYPPQENESSKQSNADGGNPFYLEASMLKVTLVRNKNGQINRNVVEVPPIENISKDVESELNDMTAPYEEKLKHYKKSSLESSKSSDSMKPKSFYLNLLNNNVSRKQSNIESKTEISDEDFVDEIQDSTPLEKPTQSNYDNIMTTKYKQFISKTPALNSAKEIDRKHSRNEDNRKVERVVAKFDSVNEKSAKANNEGKENENILKTDHLGHILRASIEKIYTKPGQTPMKNYTGDEVLSTENKESLKKESLKKPQELPNTFLGKKETKQSNEISKSPSYETVANEVKEMFDHTFSSLGSEPDVEKEKGKGISGYNETVKKTNKETTQVVNESQNIILQPDKQAFIKQDTIEKQEIKGTPFVPPKDANSPVLDKGPLNKNATIETLKTKAENEVKMKSQKIETSDKKPLEGNVLKEHDMSKDTLLGSKKLDKSLVGDSKVEEIKEITRKEVVPTSEISEKVIVKDAKKSDGDEKEQNISRKDDILATPTVSEVNQVDESIEEFPKSPYEYKERYRRLHDRDNKVDEKQGLSDDDPYDIASTSQRQPEKEVKMEKRQRKSHPKYEVFYQEHNPSYLKTLQSGYQRKKMDEIQNRNVSENEMRFQSKLLKNKAALITKMKECHMNKCKKAKWVADMCCENENMPSGSKNQKEQHQFDKSGSGFRSGKSSKTQDWPDNLSRKKYPVIKEPFSPRPPWKN